MEVAATILVEGLVQGVGFRYFVARKANGYRLKGRVANLSSGAVEIDVEGDRSLIEELIKDIRVGPRAARVTGVSVEWNPAGRGYPDFEIQ